LTPPRAGGAAGVVAAGSAAGAFAEALAGRTDGAGGGTAGVVAGFSEQAEANTIALASATLGMACEGGDTARDLNTGPTSNEDPTGRCH
jgi:hypothetical protein